MAVNNSGSLNAHLAEGMSDGKYKKVVTDRGGVVESGTWQERAQLDDVWHGIHEARTKVLGDGTVHTTPDYVVAPAPNMSGW